MDNQYNEDTDIEEDQLEVENGSNQNVSVQCGVQWGFNGGFSMGVFQWGFFNGGF